MVSFYASFKSADSRDLCIQCEGIGAAGDGSHTPDHIMIKVRYECSI